LVFDADFFIHPLFLVDMVAAEHIVLDSSRVTGTDYHETEAKAMDIVCSICQKLVLECEIGVAQGTGYSNFEAVAVVECVECRSNGTKFVRHFPAEGVAPRSDRRMQHEKELQAMTLRAKSAEAQLAAERADIEARVQALLDAERAEKQLIMEQAAAHMPSELRSSWWARWMRGADTAVGSA